MAKTSKTNLSKILFGQKEAIAILAGGANVNTTVPAPRGCVKAVREPYNLCVAKYNATAKFLDYLLVNKQVNALCGDNVVYGEFITDEGVVTAFTCDGKTASYAGELLKGYQAITPFVLYSLRNGELGEAEDILKGFFTNCKESSNKMGIAEIDDVASFCDCYYFGISKGLDDPKLGGEGVTINDSLAIETVQMAVDKDSLQPFEIFADIEGLPNFTKITYHKGDANRKKGVVKDSFEALKAGDGIMGIDWPVEQQVKIPGLDTLENFIPSPQFYSILKKIDVRLGKCLARMDAGKTGVEAIGKDYVNCFITGKPGTGKTTLAYALGASLGLPVYSIPMTKNTEEDVFQGMTKVVDGKLKFVSTDFLEAYEHGGIVVLEEINLADPAVVMGGIGQAVEFPFILQKNGYETIRRHPLCVIIGTMNVGTYGSKGVNQALSSRFKQTYTLDDPKKEDFIAILRKAGGATASLADWVYEAYQSINNALKGHEYNAEDICLNVTLRGCLGALENIEEGAKPKDAIRDTLVGKIGEADLEIAKRIDEDVVQNLRDYRGAKK